MNDAVSDLLTVPDDDDTRRGLIHAFAYAAGQESELDQRVGLLDGVCLREGVVLTRSDAALLLSIADAAAPTNP